MRRERPTSASCRHHAALAHPPWVITVRAATDRIVPELLRAAEAIDQEINAAIDAVLADLATEAYPLAKGWALDLV
jgi:hypothetical protein